MTTTDTIVEAIEGMLNAHNTGEAEGSPREVESLRAALPLARQQAEERERLIGALRNLHERAELVHGDIDDTATGWYYQHQAAIQKARALLADAEGKP